MERLGDYQTHDARCWVVSAPLGFVLYVYMIEVPSHLVAQVLQEAAMVPNIQQAWLLTSVPF